MGKRTFKEKMIKIFQDWWKIPTHRSRNLSGWNSAMLNAKKTTAKAIIIKLLKNRHKKRIQKEAKERDTFGMTAIKWKQEASVMIPLSKMFRVEKKKKDGIVNL